MSLYEFKAALNKMYDKHTMFTKTMEGTTFVEKIFFSCTDHVMSMVKANLIGFVTGNR